MIGSKLSLKPSVKVTKPTTVKVVPAAARSVVKGFEVKGAENVDLLNPRVESPRSQSPASDRYSPDPRRKDDSVQKKLAISRSNTPRCQSPSSGSGRATPEYDPRTKSHEEKRDAVGIYKSKRADSKEQLHLVVVGHVDAGKSTLLGRLLCDLGQVPTRLMHKYQQESKKIGKQSFAYAWVLDETGEERYDSLLRSISAKTRSIILAF